EVMAAAAEAMQHVHKAGILHRDLKPSNIMVDRSGQCQVIDFGLAGFISGPGAARPQDTAESGPGAALTCAPMGTREYMAPEQYLPPGQGKVDARGDVWGLGATLDDLVTRRPAFAAPTPG